MTAERFELEVPHPCGTVAACLDAARGAPRGSAVLLAHGAGAPLDSPFLEAIATALAAGGLPVLRFQYGYMERARREGRRLPPDRREHLEAVHQAALDELRRRLPRARPILLGKSLGGRIGSHLAARGAEVGGLAFLGYPLHPRGRRERLRDEHFAAIAQPALFVQGTRDELCDLALLRTSLERFGGECELFLVEGADHDFALPRSASRQRGEVLEDLAARIAAWERARFPD